MLSNAVERVHDCNPVDNPAARLLLEELLARGHAKLQIGRETRRQIDHTFPSLANTSRNPFPKNPLMPCRNTSRATARSAWNIPRSKSGPT